MMLSALSTPGEGFRLMETEFSVSTDEAVEMLDHNDIISKMFEKYPQLQTSTDEKDLRMVLLKMLEDRKFVVSICQYFSITLEDIFCMMYRQHPELFVSSVYLKKLHSIIKQKRYPIKFRRFVH